MVLEGGGTEVSGANDISWAVVRSVTPVKANSTTLASSGSQ